MHSKLYSFIAVGLLAGTGACGFSRGEPLPDAGQVDATTDAGMAGEVTFEADILPLLESRCGVCHAPGEAAGDSNFVLEGDAGDDYASVRALVNTDAPEDSRIVVQARGVGHSGGAIWNAGSAPDQTLIRWIAAGAPQ